MSNSTRSFLALMTALLVMGGAAQAAPPNAIARTRPPVNPGRGMQMMPGQDWWRVYPWSAYNAWRNPYWYPPYNTNYPYPPAQAAQAGGGYIMPTYYPDMMPGREEGMPEEQPSMERRQEPRLPHPSGALKAAPANAAVLRIDVPDRFATVTFDGQKVSSVGTTRYFVTPALQAGSNQQYTIGAVLNLAGRQATLERRIAVTPGQIFTVDLGNGR